MITKLDDMIIELSDLTPNFGTGIRPVHGNVESKSQSRFDVNPYKSFDDLLKRSRLLAVEGESCKILNIPDSKILKESTSRGKVEENHPFLLWHFDRVEGGFVILSSDDSDWTGQPALKFADLGDVVSHLKVCTPDLIKSIGTGPLAAPYLKEGASEKLNACYKTWQKHKDSINDSHLPILRNSALAFLEILKTKDFYFISQGEPQATEIIDGDNIISKTSPLLKFLYIIHLFQNIPAVNEFLDNSHKVHGAYTHYWKKNEALIWSGDDYMLTHMRIPQNSGVAMLPLKRATMTYSK